MPVPPGALNSIVKINTPWHIKVPKNIKFIVLPVSDDDQVFQQVPGILDPSVSTEINFQLRWYKQKGMYRIKAGTPMAQIIPLSEEKFELICRDANAWDNIFLQKRKYLNNFSFVLNRKIMQKVYRKHYGLSE
jgi:hypothetical protein